MKIEICTHCYAAVHPHFAAALAYQLSSLVLHRPKCDVTATVCMIDNKSDRLTDKVVEYFYDKVPEIKVWPLDYGRLGRRCIGRNVAAVATDADLIWFADADYVFRDGCLDVLAEMERPSDVTMMFPRQVQISRDHATGDAALEKMSGSLAVLDIDPAEFVDKNHSFAIGGSQIVPGNFARLYGYLDGDEKWQRPSPTMFPDTRCDMAMRGLCQRHGRILGVDLPGVYRLRHSVSSYRSKP